jgi:RecA-family ATPase
VIYLTAEDENDEIRRRLEAILKYYGAKFADIKDGFHLLGYAGRDCVLGNADRSGLVRPTKLYQRILTAAKEIQPVNISLDTCADIFAGNESDRTQVRQFVGLLRSLAIQGNSAVTVLAHPSLTGISTGTGLSGSTAWHNSVRSRMYMRAPTVGPDDIADPDTREIEFKKNNYGAKDAPIAVRWSDGIFTVSGANDPAANFTRALAQNADDELFLKLLNRLIEQDRNVSHSRTA